MNKVQFRNYPLETHVYLNGRLSGTIRKVKGGFAYYPKGSKVRGDSFPTIEACKQSLFIPSEK